MSGIVEVCEVVLTAPDPEWLERFTKGLVADRLCASVHNGVSIRSVYWWQGELREATEVRSALHTRSDLVPRIVDRVKLEHPYEVPGVVVLPITGGNQTYLEWIVQETAP